MSQRFFGDLTFGSLKQELEEYTPQKLQNDLLAGLAVALLTLPQALAHALVAGLPLSCGLFAAIFSSWVAALFGSSRYLLTGTSTAVAILLQHGTAEIMQSYFPHAVGAEREVIILQILTQLTCLVGLLQLIVVGAKLTRLMQFVSQPVIIGYISGTALAIVVHQLFVFLGIPSQERAGSLLDRGSYLLLHLHKVQWPVALIGSLSLLLLIGLKRWKRGLPTEMITFSLVALLVALARHFSISQIAEVPVIASIGDISSLSPYLSLPYFDFRLFSALLPVGFAIALLGILESTSVVRSLAADTGEAPSINQEILSLGLGNLTSSLLGAMPLSASMSRSIMNVRSGAGSRIAAIMSSMVLWVIILLFSGFVAQIPLAALAALLFIAAFNTVKTLHLQLSLKSTGSDAFVFWATFISCLFFSIDIAFYIGVFFSISTYLKKSALPQMIEYVVERDGKVRYSGIVPESGRSPVRMIKVRGALFFGAVDLFQSTLKALAEDGNEVRVLILHLKNSRDLDATACLALRQLRDYLRTSGIRLLLSGVTFPLWVVLSHSGLVDFFGKDDIFMIDYQSPYGHMEKAFKRAWEIVDQEAALREGDAVVIGSEELVPGG